MPPTTTPHAAHDELLLARLYGDDVDAAERDRALEQMAGCQECTEFFSDLGAIAAATAALPVPPRPREFTLTEADAARIGRRSAGRSFLGWLGRTRALGGSMAAIGVAGILLVGAVSTITPAATREQAPSAAGVPEFGAAIPGAHDNNGQTVTVTDGAGSKSAPSGEEPGVASASSPQASPAALAIPTAAASAAPRYGASPAAATALPTTAPPPAPAASIQPQTGPNQLAVTAAPTPRSAPQPESTGGSSGPDGRAIALATFGGLLVLGALMVILPTLVRRRSRSVR
jgi:hypothetical protein